MTTLIMPAREVHIGSIAYLLPTRRCVSDPVHVVKKLANAIVGGKKELLLHARISVDPLRRLLASSALSCCSYGGGHSAACT